LRRTTAPRPRRAAAYLFGLVLLSAAFCAALTSWFYVRGVLQREAAAEAAFVNAVARRAGLAGAFYGQRDGGEAAMHAALRRPGTLEARVIGLNGEVIAADEHSMAGARLEGDPALERALRGEAVVREGEFRWSTPFALVWPASIEFMVPVFGSSGTSAIGAVALRREPGPALAAAGSIVASIWGTYLLATAAAYALLLLAFRLVRQGEARFPSGERTDPRAAWLEVDAELRARAAFRKIIVRGAMDPAVPHLAVAPGLLGVVLRALAAHALESAADGALVLLHVRALPGGAEFAYSLPGAARVDPGARAPLTRATVALARAAEDAGGALTLLHEPERGPRVALVLPA